MRQESEFINQSRKVLDLRWLSLIRKFHSCPCDPWAYLFSSSHRGADPASTPCTTEHRIKLHFHNSIKTLNGGEIAWFKLAALSSVYPMPPALRIVHVSHERWYIGSLSLPSNCSYHIHYHDYYQKFSLPILFVHFIRLTLLHFGVFLQLKNID